jgi:hypothetical protein
VVKELTESQLTVQARRVLMQLIRRDRVRIMTGTDAVPVRQVSIIREIGKPTLVISA